jgi:acylphosphatase
MKEEMKAVVHGNVQGVGFRATVKFHADKLNLQGYVKNLPDGSVEIHAQGERASLEKLLTAIKSEFKGNYIQNIELSYQTPSSFYEGFFIQR